MADLSEGANDTFCLMALKWGMREIVERYPPGRLLRPIRLSSKTVYFFSKASKGKDGKRMDGWSVGAVAIVPSRSSCSRVDVESRLEIDWS